MCEEEHGWSLGQVEITYTHLQLKRLRKREKGST
jgi:hypothetical protein